MGQHRGEANGSGNGGFRGVSKGPVIAVASVIVLVLAVLGWVQLRDRISDQGTQAARTCVEGEAALAVTADPDIAPVIRDLGARYAATAPVVRDHCITVTVTDEPSAVTAQALTASAGGAWTGTTPAPALWIPQSSRALSALLATAGMIDGQPRSLASAAIVIAAPTVVAQAMSRPLVGWQDLPRLQTDPDGLAAGGLPNWGTLRLAMPPDSAATTAAAEAVAAATAGAGAGPVTAEQVSDPAVDAALTTLARGSAAVPHSPATTADALRALGAQDDPRDGTLHAAPATEQQLAAAIAGGAELRGVTPTGATPVADHPGVVLATDWTDETHRRAAAEFADFLRQPEQADAFVAAGFRAGDRTPAPSPAVPYAPIATELAPPAPEVSAELHRIVTLPTRPGRTTLLVDVSGSMRTVEGGDTRLANTVAALTAAVAAVPDESEVGLWVYSRGLDGSKAYRVLVPTGPVTDSVGGVPRREAIGTALASLSPATATSTYPSVQAAYNSAARSADPDRPNSVLLVTDGPNDDTSIGSSQFLASIASAGAEGTPVRVDVVTIGENSDAATLTALADRTGGTFVAVPGSDGPALTESLTPLVR
ncbi:substrate-binding domain-containing protein [Rhodococcus sp. NPDC058505]|uniref:substrate-binding domain-containing protein n=1 Tax=unclassified Rhodococcus (in: high G+C Gram-positive bacteria) TaxID=192944 RepID=UPI00364FDE4A